MVDLAGRTLGSYRLIEQLGLGGMATIYRAYHAAMDRHVAVKVLPQHLAQDPTFRARFEQEARTIARLEHRYILPVYDAGEDQGISYLVMRYTEGGTLNDLIDAKHLSLDRAVRLVSQVGEALGCAHQRGVIHRDVKPANVLLSRDGDALLTDFGIAKIIESTLQITGDGSLIGTPAYMAPEQVLGQPVDGRTDLYALGIILYEVLTGVRPFEAETPLALALMQVYNPPRLPRQVNPAIPETLEHVIVRALAKEAAKRYQTADAMVQALNLALGQVTSQPMLKSPGARERTRPDTLILPETSLISASIARPSSTVMIDRRRLKQALDELVSGRWDHVLPLLEGLPLDDPNVVAMRQEALNQLVRGSATQPIANRDELSRPIQPGFPSTQADLDRVRLDTTNRSPYLGLNTFQEQDQLFFFGRDALIGTLVAKSQQTPLLVVLGSSGSGKSSVTMAGLVPALKRGALPDSNRWRYLTLRPGARPLDTLAVALTTLEGGDLTSALGMIELLRANNHALLQAANRRDIARGPTRFVLVIDQFEELWTQNPTDPAARKAFVAQQQRPFFQLLLTAAAFAGAEDNPPILIILTMRADFLHRAAEERELTDWISEHNVIVSPMSADDLRIAIEQPARMAGGRFESGLVDELIKQVEDQPGALPLLEYTLLELWKTRRTDGTITWAAFRGLGGVEGALAARADAIFAAHYANEQRDTVRQLLVRLVQPGEGAADTRRRVLLDDLVPAGGSIEQVRALLRPLVDERLITSSRDPVTGAETIEVSHEALIRAWPTLSAWVDEVREDLRLQLSLEEAVKEWRESDEDPDFLWSSLRLARASEWLSRARPLLNERVQRFLEASHIQQQQRADSEEAARRERARLLAEQAAARRNTGRLQIFLAVAGALLLLAIFSAGFALVSRQQALGAQATAQALALSADQARSVSQELARAGESLVELERRPERALILALSSIPPDTSAAYPPMVARALYRVFDEALIQAVLTGHTDTVRSVAWSPDSRRALTASSDGTARIWDTATGKTVLILQGHPGGIRASDWSPDGRQALTGGIDGVARIWDVATGKLVRELQGHTDAILAVAWSPDGRQALTGGADGVARIWDVATGTVVRELQGPKEAIRAVAWSPDGRRAAIGGNNQTLLLWDLLAGNHTEILRGHTDDVLAVAWSPDRRQLLTGGADNVARVWDVATVKEVRVLKGHTNWVYGVAWSPDGRLAMTGSADGTARIWDAASGAQRQILRGHTNWIYAVAWSPDGRLALTGSADGTARIWDAVAERHAWVLANEASWITPGAWSADGRWVLAGGPDTKPWVWDVTTGRSAPLANAGRDPVRAVAWDSASRHLLVASTGAVKLLDVSNGTVLRDLRGFTTNVYDVAWSPNGRLALAGGEDGTARIWDVANGNQVRTLQGHTAGVLAVAWSPDGRLALTGSADNSIRLWDVATGNQIRELKGHTSFVYAVAWSPDGRLALSGGADGTARIWDVTNGTQIHELSGHEGGIYTVAWSPDGRLAITGGADGAARVWDVTAGSEIRVLQGNSDILSVGWSPDGRLALTGAADGAIRLWLFDNDQIVADMMRRACRLFTDAEIRDTIASWRGCDAGMRAASDQIAAYDTFALRAAVTPTSSASAPPPASATLEPTASPLPTTVLIISLPNTAADTTPTPALRITPKPRPKLTSTSVPQAQPILEQPSPSPEPPTLEPPTPTPEPTPEPNRPRPRPKKPTPPPAP